jgi:S1-C subfamily serine protease
MFNTQKMRSTLFRKQNARWMATLTLALAFMLSAQTVAHSQADFSALLEDIVPAVVRIEVPTQGSGSGFVVEYEDADGQLNWGIITACHVVDGAPRPLANPDALGTVIVNFQAWQPNVALRAAVVRCDKTTDSALLMPLDDAGNITTLPDYFHTLADERNDISLNRFPRLWFGNSDAVGVFESVFVLGYPSPFSEFNVSLGRISGRLSLPHVQPENGSAELLSAYLIHNSAPDEAISIFDILDLQTATALSLDGVARLAQSVLDAGHGLILLAGAGLTSGQFLVWDVTGVEGGIVQLQARQMEISGIFFPIIDIGPRLEEFASVSFVRQFFKVDAPVAPGHSGGPVLNIHGQVIGKIEFGSNGQTGANFAGLGNEIKAALFGNSD